MLVAEEMMSFEEINDKIWSVPAEIFIPALVNNSNIFDSDILHIFLNITTYAFSLGENSPL